MFDFTQNIKLDHQLHKKYILGRTLLHVFFVVAALFLADRVLLPSVFFVYNFTNVGPMKNSVINPRVNSHPDVPSNGSIKSNEDLIYNTTSHGIFSNATVTFATDSKAPDLQNTNVTIRKSYQAFLYPISEPLGFKDGTLLSDNGKYFIVSDGALREFENVEVLGLLGYNKQAFLPATTKDLAYNKIGDKIINANSYPDGSLFSIENNYYQLKNQQLLPFVSQNAFLSRFDQIQAIKKNSDFLSAYPVSETSIGYADGTLASSNISVYILSDGKSYPIANPETFLSMGFKWEDVVPIGSDELSLYQRQKQFVDNQPHPDGTLFFDQTLKQFSVVENGKRRPIESALVAKTYSKQKPIVADSNTLTSSASCKLKKTSTGNFECSENLDEIQNNIGNSYQIETVFNADTKISSINTVFSSTINWPNIRRSLSGIKLRLINNYVPNQNQ